MLWAHISSVRLARTVANVEESPLPYTMHKCLLSRLSPLFLDAVPRDDISKLGKA